ncbi:hypothetical protein BgiMline_020789 [Biomphalaria glabrata]|nr:hypothetical protein BgiMline_017971 [Biomphalaria glabrata]
MFIYFSQLIILCIMLVNIKCASAVSCGHAVTKSFKEANQTRYCEHMSQFAGCLHSQIISLGSPFGKKMNQNIVKAVNAGVKKVCHVDCQQFRVKPEVRIERAKPSIGEGVKLCAFDFLVKVGFNRQKLCRKLTDVVRCIILTWSPEDDVVTNDVLDIGTYLVSKALKMTNGIECHQSLIETRLTNKCVGSRQTRSYV